MKNFVERGIASWTGSLWAGLRWLRRWAIPRPSDVPVVAPPTQPSVSVRLPLDEQTARASGVLSEAIEAARRASELQEIAAEHLDSAAYVLERLIIELAPTMQIPGRTLAPVVARIEPQRFARPVRPTAIAAQAA